MAQKSARWAAPVFPLIVVGHLIAQVFISMQAFGQEPAAVADSSSLPDSDADAPFHSGFEAGLRVGAALPVGKAGRSPDGGAERKLSDLSSWRAPLWLDVAYRVSPSASYGLYGQLGVGGTGDGCDGTCDFSDLRIGVQGQWHLQPGSNINPWLGVGAGWESLSHRSLLLQQGMHSTELLGGPELMLQGGLELRVEKFLSLGPFVSVGVGSYVQDSYKCSPDGADCPEGSSVAGSGVHSWLSVGLSARYSP